MRKILKRKMALMLLCVMLIAGAAIPALALTGSDTHTENFSYCGVSARCISTINSSQAKARIDLTYLPAPANHWPEEDYGVKATLTVNTADNQTISYGPTNLVPGMYCSVTMDVSSFSVSSVEYYYYLNNNYTSFYDTVIQ